MIANSSPPATLRRRPGLAPTDTTLVIAARNSPAVVPSGAPRWRFSASLIWRASWNSWREIPTPGRCQLASVPGGNSRQIISKTRNFTPRLRCVIFVGRPPLCPRLDIKRIALRGRRRRSVRRGPSSPSQAALEASLQYRQRQHGRGRRVHRPPQPAQLTWSAPSVACRGGRFVVQLVTAFQLIDGLSLRLGD